MIKAVSPIHAEIARLTEILSAAEAEHAAGEAEISHAATERTKLDAAWSKRDRNKTTDADQAAYSARWQELERAVIAGSNRANPAADLANNTRSRLRQAQKAAADVERARPQSELQADLDRARAVVPAIEAKLADARERRVAAITVQHAGALNEANAALRDLPAELTFAQHAVTEAQIAVYEGAAFGVAAELWIAEHAAEEAEAAVVAAKKAASDAVDAVRQINRRRAISEQRADQLRTELARKQEALLSA